MTLLEISLLTTAILGALGLCLTKTLTSIRLSRCSHINFGFGCVTCNRDIIDDGVEEIDTSDEAIQTEEVPPLPRPTLKIPIPNLGNVEKLKKNYE
tara:strand:+ start:1426 stop:1713 length:288 start_codon:yes stop_codon:yes gene_type:complete